MCESQTYSRSTIITFRKTNEIYGGLSNMCAGYYLKIHDRNLPTSEALFQALKFPNRPDIQREITSEASPMKAKMIARKYVGEIRAGWRDVNVEVVRWCLRVKLAQNWDKFSKLLLSTAKLTIVEESGRDVFWGAVPQKLDTSVLEGCNVLGVLLMELRSTLRGPNADSLRTVSPPSVPDLILFGSPVPELTTPN